MTTVFVGLAHISSNLRSKCSTASGEVKDLADGTKAVGLFNLGDREQMVTAQPSDLGFLERVMSVTYGGTKILNSSQVSCTRLWHRMRGAGYV